MIIKAAKEFYTLNLCKTALFESKLKLVPMFPIEPNIGTTFCVHPCIFPIYLTITDSIQACLETTVNKNRPSNSDKIHK